VKVIGRSAIYPGRAAGSSAHEGPAQVPTNDLRSVVVSVNPVDIGGDRSKSAICAVLLFNAGR
jgi:hypothetical protein